MDDFETFKASREKMDPTSRKMTEHQWQQAYAAYLSARERVSGSDSKQGQSRKNKKRRHSKTSAATRGMHQPSNLSALNLRRHVVREQSAYADLRLIVDILAWVALAIVVLSVVASFFYYTSVAAAFVALLDGAVKVIGIVVARLLVQVLVDIPDIALFQSLQESKADSSSSLDASR